MSCLTYINNEPSGFDVIVSGTTCLGVVGSFTLTQGQAICMDNDYEIITCGNVDLGAECINPATPTPTSTITLTPTNTPTNTNTPSVSPTNTLTPSPTITSSQTPTITQTPTCGTYTTQYLEVILQSCHNFSLKLFDNPDYTGNANAVCDYTISGCAYGDMGTVYCGTEVMASGDHTHNFSLQPVLQPGECVSAFTVNSFSYACPCVNVIYPIATPTPTPTPSFTPTPTTTTTLTSTPTQTPTPTTTTTLTSTPSQTPTTTPPSTTPTSTPQGELYIYGKYIDQDDEIGYQINGGSYIGIGYPTTSCDYLGTITGLQINDVVDFTTLLSCSIAGSTTLCPGTTGGCLYQHTFVGTTYIYLTIDASNCC